jgi:hypothetical protein
MVTPKGNSTFFLLGIEVWAGRTNLIALQLRHFAGTGPDDCPAFGVDLQGRRVVLLQRIAEDLHEGVDDVLKAVLVIVEHDDRIRRLRLRLRVAGLLPPLLLGLWWA